MREITIQSQKYHNLFTIVDDEDFDWLNAVTWNVNVGQSNGRYVFRVLRPPNRSGGLNGAFARLIWEHHHGPFKQQIDHINHNGLDNRKQNLRIATVNQNAANRHKRIGDHQSCFKGVGRNGKGWKSQIRFNGKLIYLGHFDSEKEAAQAYDKAALKLFGEFAFLNFR